VKKVIQKWMGFVEKAILGSNTPLGASPDGGHHKAGKVYRNPFLIPAPDSTG
jgi:hypothetical protein